MYILTGGAGFIGSCVLAGLNAWGESNVLVVDNLGTGEKWRTLIGKRFLDILSKERFRELIKKGGMFSDCRAVIHLGACSTTTERDADYLLDNNFRYSQEVCEWAWARGIRFIYASSGATFGDGSNGYCDSNEATLRNVPLNMYGFSKQLFDEWVISKKYDQRVVGLKFFNVYGPNEAHKGEMASVVYKQFSTVQNGGPLILFRSNSSKFKDGDQRRDFVYVKDCVKVINYFLKWPDLGGIFNLGTGQARSWNELARALFSACDLPVKIEYHPMPDYLLGKYQNFTEAKVEKLRSAGYNGEFYSLEEGVRDYVTEYLIPGRTL